MTIEEELNRWKSTFPGKTPKEVKALIQELRDFIKVRCYFISGLTMEEWKQWYKDRNVLLTGK